MIDAIIFVLLGIILAPVLVVLICSTIGVVSCIFEDMFGYNLRTVLQKCKRRPCDKCEYLIAKNSDGYGKTYLCAVLVGNAPSYCKFYKRRKWRWKR